MNKLYWTLLFSYCSLTLYSQGVEVVSYFDADSIRIQEVITLKDSVSGILHGVYRNYFLNGNIQSTGHFDNGNQNGFWKFFYENGSIRSQGTLVGNQMHGKWMFFYEGGTKSQEGFFDKGTENGTWITFYENGSDKSLGSFVQGKKEGIWNYYYEEGQLRAQAYFRSDAGKFKEFYPSGNLLREGVMKEGREEGFWQFFYESDDKQSEGMYRNGNRDGLWIFYYPSGAVFSKGYYENNSPSNQWIYYHENGNVASKGSRLGGEKNGEWLLYYETGEIKAEGDYDSGDGEYVEYYPNGVIKSKGYVKNGKYQGKWKFYDDNGDLEGIGDFNLGNGMYTGYFPDGTIRMQGNVRNGKRVGTWKLFKPDGELAGLNKIIVENEKPMFFSGVFDEGQLVSEKPGFRHRKRRIRYFVPRLNEYRGIIGALNPGSTLFGSFPISSEYYMQERLGYEIQYIFHRKPFFVSNQSIDDDQVYSRGTKIRLRQKFYNQSNRGRMFYFGHEVQFGSIDNLANSNTSVAPLKFSQYEVGYGFFIGSRYMRRPDGQGITIDANFGFSVSYLAGKIPSSYTDEQVMIFNEVDKSRVSLPFIFTLMVGNAFNRTKRR